MGFDEIYTEIFIKKKTKVTPPKEEVTDNKESEDEAMATDTVKEAGQEEPIVAVKQEDLAADGDAPIEEKKAEDPERVDG